MHIIYYILVCRKVYWCDPLLPLFFRLLLLGILLVLPPVRTNAVLNTIVYFVGVYYWPGSGSGRAGMGRPPRPPYLTAHAMRWRLSPLGYGGSERLLSVFTSSHAGHNRLTCLDDPTQTFPRFSTDRLSQVWRDAIGNWKLEDQQTVNCYFQSQQLRDTRTLDPQRSRLEQH